jgi:Tol biopolymer transport system component
MHGRHDGRRGRTRTLLGALGAASLAIAALAGPASAADFQTTLVSRVGLDGPGGNTSSATTGWTQSVSANGRFVAFISHADNLSDEDDDAFWNVFVRDNELGTVTLVSRADGPAGAAADSFSGHPVISGNGRYVAFDTLAANLGPTTGGTWDRPYLRDTLLGTTEPILLPDHRGGVAALSDDGRFVLYGSTLGPFEWIGPNPHGVFVLDRLLATRTLVGRADGPDGAPAADAGGFAMSEDGRFVAFSSAKDLGPGDGDGLPDVYVRDTLLGTTTLASVPGNGAQLQGRVDQAAISADGRFVSFTSSSTGPSPDDVEFRSNVWLRDTLLGTTVLVTPRVAPPDPLFANRNSGTSSVSAHGRYVAFASFDDLTGTGGNTGDVFVRDIATGTTRLVSRASGAEGAQADDDAWNPWLSSDGRYVAFFSKAGNLSDADTDGFEDVFLRDVLGPGPLDDEPQGPAGAWPPTTVPVRDEPAPPAIGPAPEPAPDAVAVADEEPTAPSTLARAVLRPSMRCLARSPRSVSCAIRLHGKVPARSRMVLTLLRAGAAQARRVGPARSGTLVLHPRSARPGRRLARLQIRTPAGELHWLTTIVGVPPK